MRVQIKRKLRFLCLGVLTVLGLALAALSVLMLDKPLTKRLLFSYFSRRTGFIIAAEKMDFRLFPLRVEVEKLKAAGASGGQDLSLELGRIQAVGSLGRLFSRRRPVFTGLYAEDARLRISVDLASRQKIDWQSAAAGLQRLGPVHISDAAVEVSFSGGRADVLEADLDLRPSDQHGIFVFSMSAGRTSIGVDRNSWAFSGSLLAEGELQLVDRPALRAEVTVGSPRGIWNRAEVCPAEKISIRLQGEYLEEDNRLSFSEFDIAVPPLGRAEGPLLVGLGKNPSLDWSLHASLSLPSILKRLRPYLPSRLAALDVGGEIAAAGELRHTRELGTRTEVRLAITFNDAAISHSVPGFTWSASLSGGLTTEGVLPAIETAGEIALGKGRLVTRNLDVQNISAGARIRLTWSLFQFPVIWGKAGRVRFRLGGEERILAGVAAEARGSLERKKRRLYFDSLNLESCDFSPFHIQAEVGLGSGSRRAIRLRNSALDLGWTLSFFRPLLPAGVRGWNPEGKVAFQAMVEEITRPERKWLWSGGLSAEGLQLNNPAAAAAAAGLAPEVRLSGGYFPSSRVLSLDGAFSLAKGETLWREFYIDWAAHPVQVRWRGEYRVPARSVNIEALEVSLFPIGRAAMTGYADAGNPVSFDFQVSAILDDPASLLTLIGGPAGKIGFAAAWSGALSSDCRVKRAGSSFSLVGQIRAQDGSWRGKSGIPILSGIEARLPFYLVPYGPETLETERETEEEGFVRIVEVRGLGMNLGPLRLEISSLPNRWQIRPLTLDLWGGRASFGATTFTVDPGAFRVGARTSLVFRDGELARVLPTPAGNHWRGGFSADFPAVDLRPEGIAFQGEARGSLFSGSWTLRNLRLEQPFSPGRTIRGDLSFAGLDLEQMTEALSFGRVTGIIKGEIENLAISYGQPESFRFRLESARKEGVRQAFSLKAVDSLTILSQGEGTLPSQALFLRFVPAFPYEKIGIRCSLKNDVFLLGGLIEEDGVEYLVRRARPFGINIINRDPNKMISFKDMVSRLKRIGASKDE